LNFGLQLKAGCAERIGNCKASLRKIKFSTAPLPGSARIAGGKRGVRHQCDGKIADKRAYNLKQARRNVKMRLGQKGECRAQPFGEIRDQCGTLLGGKPRQRRIQHGQRHARHPPAGFGCNSG
jgi:hypothetical protein